MIGLNLRHKSVFFFVWRYLKKGQVSICASFPTAQMYPHCTLRKVQKILRNATMSENTFQSFNMEVYEKFFLV